MGCLYSVALFILCQAGLFADTGLDLPSDGGGINANKHYTDLNLIANVLKKKVFCNSLNEFGVWDLLQILSMLCL